MTEEKSEDRKEPKNTYANKHIPNTSVKYGIVLFGPTEVGKSAIINSLTGLKGDFSKGTTLHSELNKIDIRVSHFRGELNKPLLKIIDTPALDDCEEKNKENYQKISSELMSTKFNLVILAESITNPICEKTVIENLKFLKTYFGPEILPHIYIVFTNLDKISPDLLILKKRSLKSFLLKLLEENDFSQMKDNFLFFDTQNCESDGLKILIPNLLCKLQPFIPFKKTQENPELSKIIAKIEENQIELIQSKLREKIELINSKFCERILKEKSLKIGELAEKKLYAEKKKNELDCLISQYCLQAKTELDALHEDYVKLHDDKAKKLYSMMSRCERYKIKTGVDLSSQIKETAEKSNKELAERWEQIVKKESEYRLYIEYTKNKANEELKFIYDATQNWMKAENEKYAFFEKTLKEEQRKEIQTIIENDLTEFYKHLPQKIALTDYS